MFNYILFAIGIFISSYGISDAVELEFTIEIDPARRECFHQEIKQGTSFEFEYQVSSWHLDIRLTSLSDWVSQSTDLI